MEGLDVIVVNYKTPGDLIDFLDSYDPEVGTSLWVVNVCPEEADRKVAIEHAAYFHNVHYIEHAENVGYGRAVNDAVRHGNRHAIAIFNADVKLLPGSLEECYRALMANCGVQIDILGPRQVDNNNKITHAGIFGTNEKPEHRGWQHTDGPIYEDVREAVTVSGAAYFIKRAVWDQLTACDAAESTSGASGAFLETPHYYDETWCSYHARAHGYKAFYWGPTKVIHKWHRASPVGGWAERQMPISQAMFRKACREHHIECD